MVFSEAVETKMRALVNDPHIQHRGVHIAVMGRDLLPPALLEAIDAAPTDHRDARHRLWRA